MTEPEKLHWESLSKREQNALLAVALSQNHVKRAQQRHVAYARLAAMGLLEAVQRVDVFVMYRLSDTGKALLADLLDCGPVRQFFPTGDEIARVKAWLSSEQPSPPLPESSE